MNNLHTFVVLAYKESSFLESCIQSVLNQTYPSNVVIATSTMNDYIQSMAEKYQLSIIENKQTGKGIGYDFDFARTCVDSTLVTVAHQDDIYDPTYAEEIVKLYEKNQEATILFTDYYEIKNDKKVETNTNLKIKRILLFPLRVMKSSKSTFIKRFVLRFGNAICCPAVTFVNSNIKKDSVFQCSFQCNVDWFAWEKISKIDGKFCYCKQLLMGHRVHEDSTTTDIINNNIRTKEDFEMFCKFWPISIAKMINVFYKKAEQNNTVKANKK